jgi:predicted transposase YbfD/YdcC
MVSAFATGARLVLAQQKVAEKSNEITAIPLLLEETCNIKGKISTESRFFISNLPPNAKQIAQAVRAHSATRCRQMNCFTRKDAR